MIEVLNDYDWSEAFEYADGSETRPALPVGLYDLSGFTKEDVSYIANMVEGENDGDDWIIYGMLKDGRWFYLEAGCDYTGWDCQAGGSVTIGNSKEEIERFGMGVSPRLRFGIKLEGGE